MSAMYCTRCKKRLAVVFTSRLENGKMVNEGLCLRCAKEMGLQPVDQIMEKLGLGDEELDELDQYNDQLMELLESNDHGEDFQPGGSHTVPPIFSGIAGLMKLQEDSSGLPEKPSSQKEPGSERKRRLKKPPEEDPDRKMLGAYCTNLTARAAEGKLDNIIGRDKEIYRTIQILSRRTKNNPCLIGEPGVGKTAIAEGLAQRISKGEVPYKLLDKEIYLLDLTALVAGTQFRGQFESRVKGLIAEVKKAGNVILFIDEVHNLVGAGDAEGSMNVANILKPSLSRGEIQVIGATTFNEYRKHIEKDAALERRFQPVTINEPSIEDTVQVLLGIRHYYEAYHEVRLPDTVIRAAATLSERYITDRFLPDKAIDLIDEAAAARALESPAHSRCSKLRGELHITTRALELAEQDIAYVDYEQVAKLRAQEIVLREQLKEAEAQASGIQVTEDDLAKVIELWTGIPVSKIRESDLQKVANLEGTLRKRIVGQDEAVELVSAAIRRSRVQVSARKRPASFIFVGPTGVGKTELVKALSTELFDSVEPLIRLDMSEFMEKHSVSRIVGSPPGYVGYDEAGQLTEKVRRRPYSVVLFDEIEKAHPDVMNILLQILDEGKITDAHGRTVNFQNTVVVMTSNAGSQFKDTGVGFARDQAASTADRARKALSEFLRPEFLARVDEVVVFRPLAKEDYQRIAGLLLDDLKSPLAEKGITFTYDEAALACIAEEAFGKESGARDLIRVIRKEVEDPVARILVEQNQCPPALLHLGCLDGHLLVSCPVGVMV